MWVPNSSYGTVIKGQVYLDMSLEVQILFSNFDKDLETGEINWIWVLVN